MISEKTRQLILGLFCLSILCYFGYKAFPAWDNHDPDYAVANLFNSYLLCFFIINIPIWKLKVKKRSWLLHALIMIIAIPSCYIAIADAYGYGYELQRILFMLFFMALVHTTYVVTLMIIAKKRIQ